MSQDFDEELNEIRRFLTQAEDARKKGCAATVATKRKLIRVTLGQSKKALADLPQELLVRYKEVGKPYRNARRSEHPL